MLFDNIHGIGICYDDALTSDISCAAGTDTNPR